MFLNDTAYSIMRELIIACPEWPDALASVRTHVPPFKKEIAEYQAAALYALVKPYNVEGARILEIGTAWGFSAAVMAEAAPNAMIITLNPVEPEAAIARKHLKHYSNVAVVEALSWDYLAQHRGSPYDVIFVDGDHKNVRRDLPWWDCIAPGGAFLFHDYSPAGTYRECPPVYEALNEWAAVNEHPLDVLVVDDGGVGFAGFYKSRD